MSKSKLKSYYTRPLLEGLKVLNEFNYRLCYTIA